MPPQPRLAPPPLPRPPPAEALQLGGAATFLEPRWWNVGAAKLASGEELAYLGIPGLRVAGGQGVAVIAVCQVLLMFGPEYARACGIAALEPLGVYLPGDANYPGGLLMGCRGSELQGVRRGGRVWTTVLDR